MGKIFVGDVGTEINIDMGEDISDATLIRFDVVKPDKTHVSWAAVIDGTTKLKYSVAVGDFDQPGNYKIYPYIELPDWEGHGDPVTITVHPAL